MKPGGQLGPHKNLLTNENEIIQNLTLLCRSEPILCSKQNESGYGSNKRIVMVREQYFEYYRVPPKFFKDRQYETLSGEPKARVSLSDIFELSFLPQNKSKKKTMCLSIPSNKIHENLGEEKAKEKPKQGENHIVHWIFNFDFDIKAEINQKRNKQIEKIHKSKLENKTAMNLDQELQESILNVTNKSTSKKEPSLNVSEFYDPAEELDKNVDKLKKLQAYLNFKEELEKKERDRQKAIGSMKKLKKSNQDDSEYEELVNEIFPISNAWRDYARRYQKCSSHLGQSLSMAYFEDELKMLNEILKLEDDARPIVEEYVNRRLVGWQKDVVMFNDFEYFKGVWIKTGGKELNQQFLANHYMADIVYLVKEIHKLKFRIPLMFLMKYKGLKLLCMINMPFSDAKPNYNTPLYDVLNPNEQVDQSLNSLFKESLEYFQKILNIKCESVKVESKRNGKLKQVEAPLGKHVRIYSYENKYDTESFDFTENFYYITGIKGLFPLDYNYQSADKYEPECWLRPQIIAEYRDMMESNFVTENNQLLSSAFQHSGLPLEEMAVEDEKVKQLSETLVFHKIKLLLNELAQVNLIIVDSYSIKKYMSEMGINSRYLGTMHKLTEVPYLQETFQIEMFARTIKNIYEESIKEIVADPSFYKRRLFSKSEEDTIATQAKIHHEKMINNAIDFLNLVFGKGVETDQFWKIIKSRCEKKFRITLKGRESVKPGCLLQAVLWHCQLIIKFNLDVPLFQAERPFNKKNWVDFRTQVKSFEFSSFQIVKTFKKTTVINKNDEEGQAFIMPLLKLELLYNSYAHGMNFMTQFAIAKMNNMGPKMERPIREFPFHPTELPCYFNNKSPENFKIAIDIINFSLASNHPLYISLYDEYASEFEPELLKKSSLLASIKGLGEFHPQTTKLYGKYYHEGTAAYQIKAKRSQELDAAHLICKQFFERQKFESCMNFCLGKMKKRRDMKQKVEIEMYIEILRFGMTSAVTTGIYKKALQIVEEYSEILNLYKIRNAEDHEIIIYNSLIIKLSMAANKYYLYKLVLLVVKIQEEHESGLREDKDGFKLPKSEEERRTILFGIMNQYYSEGTHSRWIDSIFHNLNTGYLYFNYLDDLFNNYQKHLKLYKNPDFKKSLGYLDILVKLMGQRIFHHYLYVVIS